MKFYLAGRPFRRDVLRSAADELMSAGHDVTSSWLWEIGGEADGVRLDYGSSACNQIAYRDLREIDAADVLVHFSEERGSAQRGGGRFVEVGYSIAKGKQVVNVGHIENIFLGITRCCPTWEDAKRVLYI